jgi:hypothetical protein
MIDQQQAGLIGEEEAYCEMGNLFPKHTGLPFVVWVLIRGRARHDVRVKVLLGSKGQPGDLISVGIRPDVHVIEGDGTMRPYQLGLLTEWIDLNREAILQYWNEEIDTVDLAAAIRPVGVG